LKNLICDDAQNPIPNSSGGSTGNPVNFYQDERYINYARAANLLFTEWMGIRSGDKTAVFWGADRDFKEQSARVKTWARFDRVVALNSFAMSQSEILKFLERLNKLKPRYIQGYAGSLYLVAKIVNESYPLTFTPAAIRSAAEMLYDFQRQEIEKAFNSRVFNFYGSREVNNLATECSAHEGLHIFSSGRVVEIVDDNGKPVPDGIAGQIAVTDLTNFAFPFIRYLNGDIAVKSPKPCSCGRGYPLLEKIQGRTSDMIVIDGQYIHGEYFTHLFYKKPDIRQFQVIQEKDGTLRILVVSYNPEAGISDIVTKIREKVGSNVRISVEYVDRIAPTDSGKYRFTISRLDKSASKRVPDG
jgi:phenylacetate-CoA ligase